MVRPRLVLTTRATPHLKSRPRDATSVPTSTLVSPASNSATAWARAEALMSPWRHPAIPACPFSPLRAELGWPATACPRRAWERSRAMSRASVLCSVNTIALCPAARLGLRTSTTRLSRAAPFCPGPASTSTVCETDRGTEIWGPSWESPEEADPPPLPAPPRARPCAAGCRKGRGSVAGASPCTRQRKRGGARGQRLAASKLPVKLPAASGASGAPVSGGGSAPEVLPEVAVKARRWGRCGSKAPREANCFVRVRGFRYMFFVANIQVQQESRETPKATEFYVSRKG
mmetsp:Transcript_57208/g.129626  ORF Transcript_57208/g.129626 Transcript_57208/m.129626 type:complete len:288 (-) Transcript_57208:131-994(-)